MKFFIFYIIHLFSSHLNFLVFIISFLESLAFIGLILPGIIIMGGIGALIIKKKINFFYAWPLSSLGCILGDSISYYIGYKFKKKIQKLSYLKNNSIFLKKTKKYLQKYSTYTIFFGKFLGPIRPLIPIISGILKIKAYKFLILDYISCLIWPIIYFFPGILGTILIKIIKNYKKNYFFPINILLLILNLGISIYFLMIFLKFYNRKEKIFLNSNMIKLKYFIYLNIILLFLIIFYINNITQYILRNHLKIIKKIIY